MFTVAALTGARLSEVCGLAWADMDLDDLDDATIIIRWQVDRAGHRAPTKTDRSARVVPIPRELALILARHKLAAADTDAEAFVFATATGRPLGQRNLARALRRAQAKATRPDGTPTFPILHERDEHGRRVPVLRGAVPSMHGFRHTVVSRGLLAGESVDEIAFLLGHRSANVTRAVYVHEIADVRRRAMRRSRMVAEYGSVIKAAAAPIPLPDNAESGGVVAELRRSP